MTFASSIYLPAPLAAPLAALLGGLLVGTAASLLLWGAGKRAGVSGIASGLLRPGAGDWTWRAQFLGGLVVGGLLIAWLRPGAIVAPAASLPVLALAGVLVGYGTRIGGGCTSGHGICGVSRLSPRSIVAVLVFIATGVLTVALVKALARGAGT